MPLQPPQGFAVRGFEALFPHAGTLGCVVSLVPQLFLPVYPQMNVGLPSLAATALPLILSSLASHVHPSLDECFFFNSLVVRLPYIDFMAVVVAFVFKFVIVLLLTV